MKGRACIKRHRSMKEDDLLRKIKQKCQKFMMHVSKCCEIRETGEEEIAKDLV